MEIDGITTRFRTDDAYSSQWFYPNYAQSRLHEPGLLMDLLHEIHHAEVIVDIGTNLGWFLCIAATARRDAQIHGFEMDEVNYAICQKNVAINHLENVTLNHLAVSHSNGQGQYGKDFETQASPQLGLGIPGTITRHVKTITLDTYFAEKPYPQIIKMDVQGAEQRILEGMPQILNSDTCRLLYIELHPQTLSELGGSTTEVVSLLAASGFSIRVMDHLHNRFDETYENAADLQQLRNGTRMLIAKKSR